MRNDGLTSNRVKPVSLVFTLSFVMLRAIVTYSLLRPK